MGITQSSPELERVEGAEEDELEIAVDSHAIAPEYLTSGSAAFSIFAPQDLTVRSDSWTNLHTGLRFRLPCMLVISIHSCKPCLTVHPTLVDCDEEVVLPVRYAGSAQSIDLKRGEPIASALVLPVAHPEFRLFTNSVHS